MRLADRHILVTGAASGIGLAIARLFLGEGAAVALLDRQTDALAAAAARLPGAGDRCTTIVADVADAGQVTDAVAQAVTALGGLDGLVNSAGIDLMAPFADMALTDWERVLAVNLTGPMLLCQAVLPAFTQAGGGSIVNIASGAGLRPLDRRAAYCASKAGLVMLSKELALELAPRKVRVNALCPGAVDTPLYRTSWADAADPEAARAEIEARYAMARVGTPDEIADAALFLIGDEASFVTGAALAADGGRSFH